MGPSLAPELHYAVQRDARPTLRTVPPAYRPMNKESQIRFTAVLLFLLTAAAATFAWINFQKEREFQVPYDGVWWVEKSGKLVAGQVEPDGPGADRKSTRLNSSHQIISYAVF